MEKESADPPEDDKDFDILPSDTQYSDLNFKVIVIGNSGVGKTCLTMRATRGEFYDKVAATIGFEFFPFFVKHKDKIIKLDLWDTCGQEIYRSLVKNFFNNSSLAIIVYAVNDRKSFSSIEGWVRECKELCSPDVKFVLIGNKADMEEEKRCVSYEEGKKLKDDYSMDLFMETSAKTGFNSKELFCQSAKILYNQYEKYHTVEKKVDKELMEVFNIGEKKQKKKKGCC